MPIISKIRRGSWSLKLQVLFIYLVLIVGAVTMVYPFLVMVSGSFKSDVDSVDFDVIPKYFVNDEALFKKYEESRYDEDMVYFKSCTGVDELSFSKLASPGNRNASLVKEWKAFTDSATMPLYFYQIGENYSIRGFSPYAKREFANHLAMEYKNDLDAYNRDFNSTVTAWFYINAPRENYITKSYIAEQSISQRKYNEFKMKQASWHRIYMSVGNMYRYGYLAVKYGSLIDDYNKARGTAYKSYSEIPLSATVPTAAADREDWLDFVHNNLNRVFITALPEAIGDYRLFLRGKYGDISKLNHSYMTSHKSFDDVGFPVERGVAGAPSVDFDQFVLNADPQLLKLTGPDFAFKAYLDKKYGGIDGLNKALGTSFASLEAVSIPAVESDWIEMQANKGPIKWEFISRNYKMVLNYILLHGRGIFNTAVYCLLMITVALTINPMSAYALSRYNLPSTYKVLLFMMATMAFPSAVTMIPNFILLKQLNMLNTFWALVLPGMANGYSIFLLKGFFDSLPRELYEAAMLDGASEWVMFWQVTMSLSKPILAVIALSAFTGAYGAFMYSFTVCQNQDMWTLMVWLFKLQQTSHMSVTFAALIVAAIPTLIIFILSQNVIMRGIIVPQEK